MILPTEAVEKFARVHPGHTKPQKTYSETIRALAGEVLRLRSIIRDLQVEATETDDARDFTIGLIEQLQREIKSWQEKARSLDDARHDPPPQTFPE